MLISSFIFQVDVDAVDLDKYPGFSEVPWWEAEMEAGDCLHIPIFWHQQVTSTADPARKRNMAINTWFFTLNRFNHSDCEAGSQETGEVPLDTVAGTSKPKKSEIIRYMYIDVGLWLRLEFILHSRKKWTLKEEGWDQKLMVWPLKGGPKQLSPMII